MNIQNLRNDYLRIIKESENTDIKDYIKQIVEEVLSEAKDYSREVNDILKLLKTYDYRLVKGSKLNKTSAAYQRGWLLPNQNYVGDIHRVYVNKNTGDWYSTPNKDIGLDTEVTGNGPDELKPILTKADSIIKTFRK